jgi:voltage-gated potassium channel
MLNRLRNIFIPVLIVLAVGTAGYMLIEKWTFLECIYMTVITIATVGFQEVRPLSEIGRIFTIFLILIGDAILLYALSAIVAFIVEGELFDKFRRKKMKEKIKDLSEHYIVCGSTGPSEYVINEFIRTQQPFVIIENNPERVKELKEKPDILFLEGDPSEDEILKDAGVAHAKGLISALPTDKDNLFVVVTAHSLNRDMRIVSLAFDETSDHKLRRAGANSVITPNSIGGMRMASEMIRPAVVTFLDRMLYKKDATLRVEEAPIPEASGLIGRTLGEAKVGEKTGLIIIAIKDGKTEDYHYNPDSATTIKEGDVFIAIGTPEQMKSLRELVK